jgi:hypothetical protein
LSATALRRLIAGIALWKAVEIGVLHHPAAALPIGFAGLLGLVRPRAGAAVTAVASLAIVLAPAVFGQPSVNHLTWVFWIACTMAIFDGDQQRLVLRAQLSILYGFSALAKIWPDFLTGQALATRTWIGSAAPDALLVAASWATLVLEAALAIKVWARRPWWTAGLAAAVAMHLAFLLFTVTDPWRIGRLVIFGGLSVAVWLRTGPAGETRARLSG